MYRITSPHRYYRYLYPTVAGTNVYAADSVYDALTQRGRRLWWDADGNLSREYYRYRPSLGEEERMERRLCHNEEGMMQGYWQDDNDETVGAWYAYDADGHRALKYASERAAGSAQSVVELCDPVYYVSPLVTLTRTGYSKHYFEGGRRICTVIGGGFAHVNWDSITSDPMPVVGPHDDKLAKVLLVGAESTFNDCIEVRAYLSNTETLYKTMLKESEKFDPREPAFYYHTERCRSREQSHACMSYAETRQRVRSQHLGSTELRYNCSQAETKQGSGYFPCFGSEVHWTSSSYGEDCRRVQIQYLDGQTKKSNTSQAKALSCKWELAGLWFGRPQAFLLYSDTNHIGIYQFNGKERDFESGFYYYGARYHWPELWTGWTTPDPLMDKYPGISPYNYCTWNPVNLVDPDGMDTFVFNNKGVYTRTIKSDGEHVGRYEQSSGKPIDFKFADPVNDPISIQKGEIKRIRIVKEKDIKKMMTDAGVFDNGNRESRYEYIKKEGQGLGALDFSGKANGGMIDVYGRDTYRLLYLIDGVAHNPKNFGNFLFGAAGESLGFPLWILKMGAHWNSLHNSDNNGYKPQFDSKDDQFSIKCGFRHAQTKRYESVIIKKQK